MPQQVPHEQYVTLLDDVIDHAIGTIRKDLAAGVDPDHIFSNLMHNLIVADKRRPGTDRMHGIATQAIMRLAKALETR